MSGALDSRDGPWYSRRAEHLSGDMNAEYPLLDSIPRTVNDVRIRLSWWPPHVTATWLGMGVYQKLSFRPVTGAPCDWKEIAYDDSLFTDEIRSTFHRYFTPNAQDTAPPPCPSRTDAKLAPPTTGPDTSTPPPSQPSDTGTQQSDDDEYEWEDWNEGTDSWNDRNDDDWKPNTWWVHGGSWGAWEPPTPAPEITETSPPGETTITESAPPVTVSDSAPLPAAPLTPPPTIPQELVTTEAPPVEASSPAAFTVRESTQTIHTRSVVAAQVAGPLTVEDSFSQLISLQQLAMSGAPLTREGRLARQTIASSLQLSPQMYNYLVFGEVETDDRGLASITDQADSSPPP